MLNHEQLINKGFKLNEYEGQGKFYEFETTDESKIATILTAANVDFDPSHIDEKVILQMTEDFTNKLICVENNVWDLSDCEFEEILKIMTVEY